MSYLKSKKRAMKYDKESIELRKELEMMSKKSKDEFDALEKSNKTEFLLREGLQAPNLKKGAVKNKDFDQSTCKPHAEGEADGLLQVNLTNKQRKSQRNLSASSTTFTQGMSKTIKGNEDLKTKTRLHEKGVVSIRPDNPELKVVMQGRKVPKKMKNTSGLKPEDEDEKFYTEPDSADIFFYRSLSPVNVPTNVPAKFAIMGSQNTSMPVPLAPRRQLEARALNSVNSFNTQGLDEDDAFLFPWSSEGSESRVTLVSDEDRQSPMTAIKKEDKETENERSNNNLKAKIVDDAVSRTGGEGHSLSEDIPKKTQEMTNIKLGEVTLNAKSKVASDMDNNTIGFEQRASMLTKSENEINKPKDTTEMNVVDEVDDELLVEMNKIKLKVLEEERTVSLKTEQKSEVGSPITDTTIETKIKSVPDEVSNNEVVKNRVEVIEKSKKDEDNADISEELVKFELSLPLKVAVSDIVNVSGKKAPFVEKPSHLQEKKYITVTPQSHDEVTFLSTWQDKGIPASMKTGETSAMKIHHFCSQNTTVELPAHLTRVSRDMHTVDKHRAVAQRYHTPQETLPRVLPTLEGLPRCKHFDADEDWQVAAGEYVFERRLSEVADNILMNVADQGDTLENLRDAANKMFSGATDEPLNVQGTKIDLKDDSTRFYWSPAPPKLHLPPSFVRDQMFPAYQGAPVLKETLETEYGTVETVNDDSEDDESNVDKMDPEDREARERVLQRTHGSLSNIMDQLSRKPPKSVTDGQIKLSDGPSSVAMDVNKGESEEEIKGERFASVLDVRRQMGKIRASLRVVQTTTNESDDSELFSSLETERRPQSQPDLSNELSLCVPSDYHTSMQELEEQAALVSAIKSERKSPTLSENPLSPKDETSEEKRDLCNRSYSLTTDSAHQESYAERREDGITDTNSVITTTSRGVFSTRKTGKISRKTFPTHARKAKKDTLDDQERMRRKKRLQKKVQEFLNQPPRMITRSESLHSLSDQRMLRRSSSLPCLMDYQSLNNENMSEYDLFFWIQDEYWYKWLDEVYPPSSAPPDILRDMMSSLSARNKSSSSRISSNVLDEIEVIEPHIDEDKKQLYEDLENEVEKLSEWINQTENQETLALYLSRRGAIYRKLGLLKKAWDDLQRSIKLEPQLVDSRWHRHLLFLLNDKPKKALEDLTFIIKNNSKIVKAYRSKAEIYKKEGDTTMAILNYSQAIKLKPDEADIYYRRASVFESRGDVILALEDYKIAAELLPSKTEAMFNIGQYYFNQKNWPAALISFTKILKQDPLDAKAYLYRGKVCAKQSAFNESLKDLSCAIHLDPMSAEAFYNRGCLLRKIHPQKALQDLSVSLLLDSRVENVNAFLHRGIIYTDLKRWDEAVSDFESALRLDKCIPSAHVNIGLILITKHENYARAIKRFSAAVRVDPSYIRGYVCRADAYDKVGNLKESIHDYTRAIHVRPDVADYRMARGKLLLKQNKLELASFHIRQGAELSQDLGGSATQQAVVHAFLKDYNRAVDILTKATRINPTAPMFILLGKICMKAKQFENAIASFKRAIYVMTPWHPRMEMPLSAASVYFMIGTCFTELNNLVSALDAFNNAIKVNPEDAEAYYNRGLTKMKLRHAKSIHDFNRALAINPKLFQAFLSRAAYYGMKGRFSKGIMNCNEAIKLQPRSVRAYLYRDLAPKKKGRTYTYKNRDENATLGAGHLLREKQTNEAVREMAEVECIEEKLRDARLRCYGHVYRRKVDHPLRRVVDMPVPGKRKGERPHKRWEDTVKGI